MGFRKKSTLTPICSGNRQQAEQTGMNDRGGKGEFDNKREEIAAKKWGGAESNHQP